jgi:hypothetical protein
MKNKIGFIAISIITVLATLGIGFSMWSQTVTINGSVNTGNVTLTVTLPTGTWAYKDEGSDTNANKLIWVTGAVAASANTPQAADPCTLADGVTSVGLFGTANNISGANWQLIGSAYCSITGTTVTATWSGLFPVPTSPTSNTFNSWNIDFQINNTGSIPVKFTVTNPTTLPAPTTNNGTKPTFTVKYGTLANLTTLEGYQLDPQGYIEVFIGIGVNEGTAQSYSSGTVSWTITGEQWNEYTAPATTIGA